MKERIVQYKGFELSMYQKRLKEIRREKNKTQKQMSELINMSEEAWGKNERGECVPSTEFLLKLYKNTGIDIESLFFEEKEEQDRIVEKIQTLSDASLSIILLEVVDKFGVENSKKLIGKIDKK